MFNDNLFADIQSLILPSSTLILSEIVAFTNKISVVVRLTSLHLVTILRHLSLIWWADPIHYVCAATVECDFLKPY